MPSIADRLQQGMLDALYLGRLMIHPQGLAANPLLQQDGRPIASTPTTSTTTATARAGSWAAR